MSIDAMKWAWSQASIENSGALFVLVVLGDRAGSEEGEDWTCYPSVAYIAGRTRLSERAVERHLLWLISEGYVSREARGVRKAEKGKFLYTLHRQPRLKPSSPDNLAGEAADLHPPETTVSPAKKAGFTRQFGVSPTPPNIADPSIIPHEPSACVGARDAEFEGLAEAWAKGAPGRVDMPKARTAFEAAVAGGFEAAFLLACGLRYLAESRDAKAGKAPMLDRWLTGERWRGFEPVVAGGAAGAAPMPAVSFEGWPGEVAEAVRGLGVGSALAGAAWRDGAIVARNGECADRISRALRAEKLFDIAVRKP